jgi:hypothetical protein
MSSFPVFPQSRQSLHTDNMVLGFFEEAKIFDFIVVGGQYKADPDSKDTR